MTEVSVLPNVLPTVKYISFRKQTTKTNTTSYHQELDVCFFKLSKKLQKIEYFSYV